MKIKLILAVLALSSFGTRAAELTADEVVAKANQAFYYAGKDGKSEVKMVLSDGRTRDLVILRRNADKGLDQKFYVYFKGPADVRKMSYLVHKHPGKGDDRWLFLPSLNLVKRIAPGDKRTSFAGSDFLYEDVSGRGLDEDTHELVKTTDTQYVIKNVPKNPGSVEFSSYTTWIDKKTFLPMKSEYLDKNGKVYRVLESTKIETIDGIPTVVEAVAKNLKSGSSTTKTFFNIKYNVRLKDRIFTERFLRRPPREVTR
jgi:outer membrane lipoprotein-sorting protein